jgi:hypothetical protein
MDNIVNREFSYSLDRHYYFDYPKEFQPAMVKNLSPVKTLKKHESRWKEIFQGKGNNYLSEVNLPWPNRFQHELIPALLYLSSIKPLNGVWFYDYRFRGAGFHDGGLFGIQRFRSIVGQLPYLWRYLNSERQCFRFDENGIYGDFENEKMFSGWKLINGKDYPLTMWTNEDGVNRVYSMERAEGDSFKELPLYHQETVGIAPLELVIPGT